MNANVRRLVMSAFFAALALVVFVVEAQFPPLFIPGAKLGLSNIFSLFALVLYGPGEALAVVLVRTLLGSLITGSVGSLVYSLTAGLIAVAAEAPLVKFVFPRISIVAVSVTCAVLHNIVQCALFVAVNGAPQMLAYMPYLALIGVPSGALVGLAVYLLIRHLPVRLLFGAAQGGISEKD